MTVPTGILRQQFARQLADISDAPAREADWLIEHVCGWNRQQQLLNPQRQPDSGQLQTLQRLLDRRLKGEPFAYVIGEQHFWTLRLQVTPDVLIPRPETELVVERALQHLSLDQAAQVLDLGTGSGAIALAIAQERPRAQLHAVDQSPAALALATNNAVQNEIPNVRFAQSNWFSALSGQCFQIIASNPPYIAEGDPHLQASVLAHEPRSALLSGADGLQDLRQIIADAPAYLLPGGWLIVEHGWQQAAAIRVLLESAGWSSVASHADLAGHQRVTEAQRP